MTPVTIQCTMIHSGKGQGTSKVHLDRLQKAQENMREASAWFPSVQCNMDQCNMDQCNTTSLIWTGVMWTGVVYYGLV